MFSRARHDNYKSAAESEILRLEWPAKGQVPTPATISFHLHFIQAHWDSRTPSFSPTHYLRPPRSAVRSAASPGTLRHKNGSQPQSTLFTQSLSPLNMAFATRLKIAPLLHGLHRFTRFNPLDSAPDQATKFRKIPSELVSHGVHCTPKPPRRPLAPVIRSHCYRFSICGRLRPGCLIHGDQKDV